MFSRALGREGPCRHISLTCVGSARSFLAILGLPPLAVCVLSPSTLLRLQAALQGAGLELRALPRPKPLRSGFRVPHKGADLVGPAFCAFPTRAAQAARSLTSAVSPGASRLIPSTVPASVSGRSGPVRLVSLPGS